MKRVFDILVSLFFIVLLSPVLLIIVLAVLLSGPGGVLFRQIRVGRGGEEFHVLKFRTMRPDSEKGGQLTVGGRDPRITRVGYVLRQLKLDELPQLFNVLAGQMSVVGPRPEVPKYVALYNEVQRRVLSIRPGITDYASIRYFDENEILAKAENPEQEYIEQIMPAKLEINLEYIDNAHLGTDVKILWSTLLRILRLS